MKLDGRTVMITGATRGIGKAIALRCAKDGANVAVIGKSVDGSGQLPGTIHETATEVEKAGGKALPLQVDVRDADKILEAVETTAKTFGGIDVLINNAGAIKLAPIEHIPPKRFDLMMGINCRAPYTAIRACLPHFRESSNPHVLNISPPIQMEARWLENQVAYTISKYGMSMLTLGLSAELDGIGVNSLWPKTIIATAAITMLMGEEAMKAARKPEIMADAAHAVLTSPAKETTGNFFIDEELLASRGVTDFDAYAVEPGNDLIPDLYIP